MVVASSRSGREGGRSWASWWERRWPPAAPWWRSGGRGHGHGGGRRWRLGVDRGGRRGPVATGGGRGWRGAVIRQRGPPSRSGGQGAGAAAGRRWGRRGGEARPVAPRGPPRGRGQGAVPPGGQAGGCRVKAVSPRWGWGTSGLRAALGGSGGVGYGRGPPLAVGPGAGPAPGEVGGGPAVTRRRSRQLRGATAAETRAPPSGERRASAGGWRVCCKAGGRLRSEKHH